MMKVINDDSYEELAAEWQFQMIQILKDKLLKYGVDAGKAKDISGEFAFELAMLQDQGQIKVNSEEYRPVICFDDLNGNLKYNSDDDCQLHDYAFGNADEAFEQ